MGLFPWLWLSFAYIWQMRFQILHGREILDSDLAAEMVLANFLNKEHSILSKNWFYSTELRVFESQWFYRLGLLLFPNNWHMARVTATMLMVAIFAALVIIVGYMLGLGKYTPWAAGILLCPFGRFWLVFSLYGTYYLVYAGFSLITLIAVIGMYKSQKKLSIKDVGFCVLGVLAAFASGLNGIKQFILFFAPLMVSVTLVLIFSIFERGEKITGEKDLISVCSNEIKVFFISAVLTVINIAGYLVNSRIFKNIYSFTDFGETAWAMEPDKRLYDLLVDFVSLFGYEKGDKVLSIRGILSGAGLIFGVVLVIALLYMLRNLSKLEIKEKMIVLICGTTICLCMLIFCFVRLYQNYHWLYHQYYWLPVIPFLIYSLMFAIKRIIKYSGIRLKLVGSIVAVIGAVLITSISKNTMDHEINNPLVAYKGYTDATEFLMENNLINGYGMFWSCAVIRELSDGVIEMRNITNPDTFTIHEWLQEKEHALKDPEGEVFLIIDSSMVGEEYAKSGLLQGNNNKEIYSKDNVHIYLFESTESLKNAGAQ